jgi:hypothetical protein
MLATSTPALADRDDHHANWQHRYDARDRDWHADRDRYDNRWSHDDRNRGGNREWNRWYRHDRDRHDRDRYDGDRHDRDRR